ncbi:50S ribosomal protein L25/general stress protein Ctc [Ferrimonas marina]|uniref:Large ribosomal subunit protein bL25 n=1 Tax=Ferrimonas marina TaxID=299255 RepID=A0A1M5SDN3_9GAMM|nr:50S ribosomal protein L25/general stress protein Ctc [Ferrimonas marina]SHH36398.1 large subunit ribosomal protein L25 [Ferrimonas marina]
MSDFEFDAEIRTDLGTGASRRLRREGLVPAVLYGGDKEPVSLTLAHNKINKAQENEAFYSHVLTLNINGQAEEAIVKAIQRHPYKPKLMHLDFQRVVRGTAMTATVPLHFVNEEDSAGARAGGTVMHLLNEVEVRCLPRHLPEFIEVDILSLDTGHSLHLSDIQMPEGVELVALSKGDDSQDLSVVTIKPPKGASDDEAEDGETPEQPTEE